MFFQVLTINELAKPLDRSWNSIVRNLLFIPSRIRITFHKVSQRNPKFSQDLLNFGLMFLRKEIIEDLIVKNFISVTLRLCIRHILKYLTDYLLTIEYRCRWRNKRRVLVWDSDHLLVHLLKILQTKISQVMGLLE